MQEDNSDIWGSFRSGDEKSLKEIYDQNYDMLMNYGYKFTSHVHIIEEAIQSLFIKMWRNRLNLNKPSSLRHYLLKAFRNTLVSQLQSESRRKISLHSFEALPFTLVPPPDERLIDREETGRQRQLLQSRMHLLTNRQREAIYLRFFQELSYEEIASLLKMNIGSVYKLIYRAIERLRSES